jgi:hypothetical protein
VAAIATTHGYVLAFRVGSVSLAVGAVLVLVLLERVSPEPRQVLDEPDHGDGDRPHRVSQPAR